MSKYGGIDPVRDSRPKPSPFPKFSGDKQSGRIPSRMSQEAEQDMERYSSRGLTHRFYAQIRAGVEEKNAEV